LHCVDGLSAAILVRVVRGISQVLIEVEDLDRALSFWTGAMGLELVQDSPYGQEREVRTPDHAVTVVLSLRQGEAPTAPERLPTSNLFFYCDLPKTYEELRASGVEFPQPPVRQP
jgi:catechol 2,3-dioxygenase-like lactoylglutathione lyase family enzyme